MTTAATPKGERTRAKLVDTTASLLQRQGFHATGLAQILAESGAPRGSLYFYFPGGKEELACTALAESGAHWRKLLDGAISAAPSLGAAVTSVCELLAMSLEASGWQNGCPLATVALEASSTSEPVRALAAEHYGAWEALIAARLRTLGVEPELAARMGTFALSAIEGALMLAKVKQTAAPLRAVGETLRALVDDVVPRIGR